MANFIVTITGADDNVDPKDLIELNKEYPFVEWAILFSSSANGTDRYPTASWRKALYAECLSADDLVSLSAHLCGKLVDERLNSFEYLSTEIETFFRRIQFNRFNLDNYSKVVKYSLNCGCPVIVPFNKKVQEAVTNLNSFSERGSIHVLADSSGGRGVSPAEFPSLPQGFELSGYAGGISEDNIDATLKSLANRHGKNPFWIDLETGARTLDNKFDLKKVQNILEIASKFYGDSYEPSRIILPN
jgi:phosphoribosylanthranilate isomerase